MKKKTHIPTHNSWRSMLGRCYSPKTNGYDRYGGRGIKVCDEWMSYKAFLFDMGERPKDTVLDRKDNELGYFASNCRWVTRSQSARNRRSVRLAFIDGETEKERGYRIHKDWISRNGDARQSYMNEYRVQNKLRLKERYRKWSLANKEKRNISAKKYRESHKLLHAKRCREWYLKNKQHVSQKGKVYRELNRDRIKIKMQEYHKSYYAKNRDKILARTKLYAQTHPAVRLKIKRNRQRKLEVAKNL